jgi:hypothetical protein
MPRNFVRRIRCEPTVRDLLSDPVILAVMEADGVDPDGLEADLSETARALRRRPTSWSRCRDMAPQGTALHG